MNTSIATAPPAAPKIPPDLHRPMRAIWLAPGRTVAWLAHENPGHLLHTLPILSGFSLQLSLEILGLPPLLADAPLLALVNLYLTSYLLAAILWGAGGQSSPPALRVALAWSHLPILALIPLDYAGLGLLELLEIAPQEVLHEFDVSIATLGLAAFMLAQITLLAWSLLILVRGVVAVGEVSMGKAILTVLIAQATVFFAMLLYGFAANRLPTLAADVTAAPTLAAAVGNFTS